MKSLRKHLLLWIVLTIVVVFLIHLIAIAFPGIYPMDGFGYSIIYHFSMMFWFSIIMNRPFINYNHPYYHPKPLEANGRLYKKMGVDIYRILLKLIGWEKLTSLANAPVRRNSENLKTRILNTKKAELAHGFILLLSIFTMTYMLLNGQNIRWMLIGSVVFHLFPVLLQRYNRLRFIRVLDKMTEDLKSPK